ncbi:phage baseplate assembly protein V [Granulicella arctica]|uniref:phage baseplate assembly protein V n=1 Tax=Granulicella arctica TaxID=940613 RepID=UPI0021DFE521|nr:phage baseplate assembly protein V [Granulicella arctica]
MSDLATGKKFYGKYRGTVVLNVDPEQRGRITCTVPDVLGPTPSSWCEACAPLAGPTGTPMGAYLVPPIGTSVWVEFEQGDPEFPVWTGCRFDIGSPPSMAMTGSPVSPSIIFQTSLQNTIAISDMPGVLGGIMLQSTSGVSLIVNDTGIYMTNGKGATVTLIGNTVNVNDGALTVL